jgi:hypothetical protein
MSVCTAHLIGTIADRATIGVVVLVAGNLLLTLNCGRIFLILITVSEWRSPP